MVDINKDTLSIVDSLVDEINTMEKLLEEYFDEYDKENDDDDTITLSWYIYKLEDIKKSFKKVSDLSKSCEKDIIKILANINAVKEAEEFCEKEDIVIKDIDVHSKKPKYSR